MAKNFPIHASYPIGNKLDNVVGFGYAVVRDNIVVAFTPFSNFGIDSERIKNCQHIADIVELVALSNTAVHASKQIEEYAQQTGGSVIMGFGSGGVFYEV